MAKETRTEAIIISRVYYSDKGNEYLHIIRLMES